MPAGLDSIALVDERLAYLLVVRDQVIRTAPSRVKPMLSEHWWSKVDELLELRLQLQEQG
jgi:hypothetical protein